MKRSLTGLGLILSATAAFAQEQRQQPQINIVLNDEGKIPAIRRTDPRDEPVLLKIVEERSPGTMAALFALGYLREPTPRTRDTLRAAARSAELLNSYPAICSLWRIDDPEWETLAAGALPRLARLQQLHVASLLFRAGEYSRWPLMRDRMIETILAAQPADERLKGDVFQMIAAAWRMTDGDGEGASLRDLRRRLGERPEGRFLEEFDPRTVPLVQ